MAVAAMRAMDLPPTLLSIRRCPPGGFSMTPDATMEISRDTAELPAVLPMTNQAWSHDLNMNESGLPQIDCRSVMSHDPPDALLALNPSERALPV